MEANGGTIKLGRINRACEKALGISLVDDVGVYMGPSELDRLAASRPHDYLQTIEEIGAILKAPDYVRYEESKDELVYLKEYIQNDSFVKVAIVISHLGDPKRWCFSRMHRLSEENIQNLNRSRLFVRVKN